MAGFLKRLFGGKASGSSEDDPVVDVEIQPLKVDRPLAVIGDIHGCHTLNQKLVTKIKADTPDATLVFVGDYIDRGEESRQVIETLMEMPEAICLMGNHERMLLDFLDHPEERGNRWLRNGGLQTLASYGVSGSGGDLRKQRDALAMAMGDAQINWLIARPLFAKFGNLYAIHASADPFAPIEDQGEKPLIWGHPKYRKQGRFDGNWTVHGHTIVDAPVVSQGRVSIDTGAYATHRLTAAIFEGSDVRFEQANF